MPYQYILLDADDTLYDFRLAQENTFRALLARYGVPFSREAYARYDSINESLWKQFERGEITKRHVLTSRFDTFFAAYGIALDSAQADAFFQHTLGQQPALLPGAEEVCAALSTRAVLAIVTNGVGSTQRSRFALSPLHRYIPPEHLIISEEVGAAKPDPYIFGVAFERIGCKRGDSILMVGDSLSSDMQGALNAGIDCCWYNPRRMPRPAGMPITHELTDLLQLLAL